MYMNVFTDGNRIFTTGDFMDNKEELAREQRRFSVYKHLGVIEWDPDKKPAPKKGVKK